MATNFYDAQAALGFVVSQTSHIEREVNETVYPDIQYPGLVPVDTSAHPFAKSVTYYSSDKFGAAGWINGNSDDIPLAGSERSKHETAVHMAGIGYGFGLEEINHAQMLGINLQAEDALAARRAYEEMVDRVVLEGDSLKGFDGLFDYTGVTVAAATTGDWTNGSTTEDQMLGDVNDAIQGVHTASNTTAMADTVLLPYARFNLLASTRLGDTQGTVLEFLRRNNIYTATTGRPLEIRGLRKLDTAGTSGGTRMVVYRRSPQVLKVHIPMPHRFLPVWQAGPLRWEVPGIFRLGGLDIRRPSEVRYSDGI
jgi:hypothetical protein